MRSRLSLLCAAGLLFALASPAPSAEPSHDRPPPPPAGQPAAAPVPPSVDRLRTPLGRYDQEYPTIDYSGPATQNRIWRLQQDLDSGRLKLQWEPKWGYLRSLLKALQIDIDTQVLVFSETSLQSDVISDLTPRAVYFNEDTYVGFVHGSPLLELAAIDARKGAVFFVMENTRTAPPRLGREAGNCLSCHDTFSLMGGGVPRVLAMTAPVDDPSDARTVSSASEVDDRTPIAQRWGGWYVTGRTGRQRHFGNLPLRDGETGANLRRHRDTRLNRASLAGYFDTGQFFTDRSDVVALLVLEHQTSVQNLMTRLDFKVRALLARAGGEGAEGRPWEALAEGERARVRSMAEPLVRALFFHQAAPFEDRIEGSSGFAARFSATGPRDAQGRGLRQLDLGRRLFRHPLSYLVESAQFLALPPAVREYVQSRIVEVLTGADTSGIAAGIDAAERAAVSAILQATHPQLGERLRAAAVARR